MTRWIFGRRLYGNINAVIQGPEKEGCCPGVVHHDDDVAGLCNSCDCWNVLHLECVGTGRFCEHHARVRLHQRFDSVSCERVVILDVDTEASQHRIRKVPRRVVDGIGDEQVVAGR